MRHQITTQNMDGCKFRRREILSFQHGKCGNTERQKKPKPEREWVTSSVSASSFPHGKENLGNVYMTVCCWSLEMAKHGVGQKSNIACNMLKTPQQVVLRGSRTQPSRSSWCQEQAKEVFGPFQATAPRLSSAVVIF